MKNFIFTIILIFQLLFFTKVFSQTQNNRFMIGWYDYSYIETSILRMRNQYDTMRKYNINCSVMPFRLTKLNSRTDSPQWASSTPPPSKEFLDSAYTYGIKVIPYVPENSVLSDSNGYLPYDNTKAQQGLAYWGNHPALGGFYIKDELFSRDDINYVKPHAHAIQAFNPDLLRFAIIPPVCNDEEVSYSGYESFVQDYITTVQPNTIFFDCYPLTQPHDTSWPQDLFYNIDIIARKSAANKIPFNYIFCSFAYLEPSGSKFLSEFATSYFVYTGLFYGTKGITYWNNIFYVNNFPSKHKELMKNLNKKILDNEDILLSLEFKSAYHKSTKTTIGAHKDSIPNHSKWQYFSSDPYANEIFNVNNPLIAMSGSTIDSLAVSFLTDDLGNRYFWVFNLP